MPTPMFQERPRNGDEPEEEFDIDLDELVELEELEDLESDIPLLLEKPPVEPPTGSLAAFSGEAVDADEVVRLSDLGRNAVRRMRAEWPAVPVESRRQIVRLMDELAEARFELAFGRALRIALADEDDAVRQLALAALWNDESSDLAGLLLQIIENDPSFDVRAAAARAILPYTTRAELGEFDDDLTDALRTRLLAIALDSTENPLVQRHALEAASVFGGEEIADLIETAYDSGEQDQMGSALYAMGRSSSLRWLSTVLTDLESDDAHLRFEAARAAGMISSDAAVPDLLAMMDGEEDVEVRHAAIGALGHIGGKAAIRALKTLSAHAEEADVDVIQEALEDASVVDGDSGQ